MQRLGIIGFGSFGRFAAAHLRSRFEVLVTDRSVPVIDPATEPQLAGVRTVSLEEAIGTDVVVLAVPVQSFEGLLKSLEPHWAQGSLVVEVASVKERPADLLSRHLPEGLSWVGLHPMFGPQSGKDGIAGLKVVQTRPEGRAREASAERQECVAQFLRGLDLQVLSMKAADHDREMAYIQGLTHWIAKALREVRLPDVELATPAYRHLLRIEEILREDSPELFLTIQRENPFARSAREELTERLREIERLIEG